MASTVTHAIHAIYRHGVLDPLDPLDLPEGARVRVEVHLEEAETLESTGRTPRTVPASRLSRLVGIVSLGGDALEDSEALYDQDSN